MSLAADASWGLWQRSAHCAGLKEYEMDTRVCHSPCTATCWTATERNCLLERGERLVNRWDKKMDFWTQATSICLPSILTYLIHLKMHFLYVLLAFSLQPWNLWEYELLQHFFYFPSCSCEGSECYTVHYKTQAVCRLWRS